MARKKETTSKNRSKKQPTSKLKPSPKKSEPVKLFAGQNSPKKLRKLAVLDQWIEVSIQDGVTQTTMYPPNAHLIELGQQMDPAPEFVFRRFNFVDGVPEEYSWTEPDEQAKLHGGGGIQRMTVETWLELTKREAHIKHAGPTTQGNLPRPNERGGCECPTCVQNAPMLEQVGLRS